MKKYKCIQPCSYNNKTIMNLGDIVVTDECNTLYNITKGFDYKLNNDFEKIKHCLVNVTDEYHPGVTTTKSYVNNESFDEDYNVRCQSISDFEIITEKLYNTYKKKNSDYGNSFNKTIDTWGLQAAGIRMSDKLERFNNIVKNNSFKVKDESIIDTLEDLATYAIMTVIYIKNNGYV